MHVLIVEDQRVYRECWEQWARARGHSVATATTVTEALREFENNRPRLIICDNDIEPCGMYEDMFDGGFFFISHIRRREYHGRIILCTGSPQSYFAGEIDITPLRVRFIQKRLKR